MRVSNLTAPATRAETIASAASHGQLMSIRSFSSSFSLLFAVMISAFLIQNLHPDFTRLFSVQTIVTFLMLGAWAVTLVKLRKEVFLLLTSYHFAVSVLATSAISVILGTLILQNAPSEEYLRLYGNPATAVIQKFFLYDIFHSLWFGALLFLTALSLLMVLLKRNPFRLTQWGFLLSHGGIITILIGALIGSLYAKKGFIDLTEGNFSESMRVMKNGKYTGGMQNLGFAFKLEDFQVDYYKGDYKLYAYRLHRETDRYELLDSFAVQPGDEIQKIKGTGLTFRIKGFLSPQSQTEQNQPDAVHFLISPSGRQEVSPGKTYEAGDGWQAEILQFIPHFAFNIEAKTVENLSNEPQNPAIQLRLKKGNMEQITWLFARMPGYSMHGKSTDFPSLIYSYAIPKRQPSIPVADLEIMDNGSASRVSVTNQMEAPVKLRDGEILLLVDRREDEVKEYRSVVSVWEKGKEQKQQTLAVNSPLKYKGYSFYQSNYDPENLTYSGFLVVKDPGLGLVYGGFIVMSLGVVFIFYIRPRIVDAGRNKQRGDES